MQWLTSLFLPKLDDEGYSFNILLMSMDFFRIMTIESSSGHINMSLIFYNKLVLGNGFLRLNFRGFLLKNLKINFSCVFHDDRKEHDISNGFSSVIVSRNHTESNLFKRFVSNKSNASIKVNLIS